MAPGEWFSPDTSSGLWDAGAGRGWVGGGPVPAAGLPPLPRPQRSLSFPSSSYFAGVGSVEGGEAGLVPGTPCRTLRRRAWNGNWKSSCWGTAPPGRSVLWCARRARPARSPGAAPAPFKPPPPPRPPGRRFISASAGASGLRPARRWLGARHKLDAWSPTRAVQLP